jgi:hypothetical protein
MSRALAHQGPSVELVRAAFAAAGHPVLQLGVSGRGADLLVADRYLVSVRAMHGAETATPTTQIRWWRDVDIRDPYVPVMVVRGSRGFTTAGWSVWIPGALVNPDMGDRPVRLWFDDFMSLPLL